MLLNDMKMPDTDRDDIYYELDNGNAIKLGEYAYSPEYKHVEICISNIIKVTYEGDNGEMSTLPHMYWFRCDNVCDRYHGFVRRDDPWVNRLFESVSPFTNDINVRIEEFFRLAFDRAQNMPGK